MGVVVEEKGSGLLQKGWCPVIGGDVKLLAGIVLLLVLPIIILNPLGRSAFVGYYTGVIASWAAYVIALRRRSPKDNSGAAFKLTRPRRTKA
jgi:hypothetical protein